MENANIFPGIVESRRKIYSPNKEGVINAGSWKTLYRQYDSDIARLKEEMKSKETILNDLETKCNLLHSLIGHLYHEKEVLVSEMKEMKDELNSLKHRECVLHSDTIASIWKTPSL